jgi:predicted acetyltransferase
MIETDVSRLEKVVTKTEFSYQVREFVVVNRFRVFDQQREAIEKRLCSERITISAGKVRQNKVEDGQTHREVSF